MSNTISETKRKRGFFGHIFRILFFLWNAAMLAWFISYLGFFGTSLSEKDEAAAQVGTVIGGFIGTGLLLMVWTVGAFVTGMLMLATRGRLITTTRPAPQPRERTPRGNHP